MKVDDDIWGNAAVIIVAVIWIATMVLMPIALIHFIFKFW